MKFDAVMTSLVDKRNKVYVQFAMRDMPREIRALSEAWNLDVLRSNRLLFVVRTSEAVREMERVLRSRMPGYTKERVTVKTLGAFLREARTKAKGEDTDWRHGPT